jgi:hypothetical protein
MRTNDESSAQKRKELKELTKKHKKSTERINTLKALRSHATASMNRAEPFKLEHMLTCLKLIRLRWAPNEAESEDIHIPVVVSFTGFFLEELINLVVRPLIFATVVGAVFNLAFPALQKSLCALNAKLNRSSTTLKNSKEHSVHAPRSQKMAAAIALAKRSIRILLYFLLFARTVMPLLPVICLIGGIMAYGEERLATGRVGMAVLYRFALLTNGTQRLVLALILAASVLLISAAGIIARPASSSKTAAAHLKGGRRLKD